MGDDTSGPPPPIWTPSISQPVHSMAFYKDQIHSVLHLIETEVEPQLPPVQPALLRYLKQLLDVYGGIIVFTNVGFANAPNTTNLPRPLQPVDELKHVGSKSFYLYDASDDYLRENDMGAIFPERLRVNILIQKRGLLKKAQFVTVDLTATEPYEMAVSGNHPVKAYDGKYYKTREDLMYLLGFLKEIGIGLQRHLSRLLVYYDQLYQVKEGLRWLQSAVYFGDLQPSFDLGHQLAKARQLILAYAGPNPVKLYAVWRNMSELRGRLLSGQRRVSNLRDMVSVLLGQKNDFPTTSMVPVKLWHQLMQLPHGAAIQAFIPPTSPVAQSSNAGKSRATSSRRRRSSSSSRRRGSSASS